MKAIVHHKYGSPDVLKLEDVDMPTPTDNEVRIKVHAVSINGSDREGLIGKPLYARMRGLRKPGYPILGSDIAGRVEVTGVDNTVKMDFLRSLGADHVIDYTQQDFTKNRKQYDLILDLIAHRSVFAYARAIKPHGTYFFVGGSVATLFQILLLGPWIRKSTSRNIRLLVVPQNSKDLLSITELCEAGKVIPVIDRRYPLSEVPGALRYVVEGRAKGKVVITVEQNNKA